MRIAAQKINNRGVEVSKTLVRQTTEKYVKQYGQACEKLYAMGYIADPSIFSEDAFFACLFAEHPNIIPLCRNMTTGKINITDKQLSYVQRVLDDDDKVREVLSTAISVLQASQALEDIRAFMGRVRFQKKSDILLCRSSLTVSSRVYNSGKVPLDGPYMMECFNVPADSHVTAFYYGIEQLRVVLQNIGVDCSDLCFTDDSVLLGDGFTVRDDCRFLRLVISGDIEGNGKYASQLHKAVENYYTEYYRTRTTVAECLKYEDQVFLDAINSSISSVNAFRNTHPDYEEFFVDSERVYFLVPGVEESPVSAERDIFVGEDISSIGSTPVDIINRLLGYSGKFIHKFDSELRGYEVTGSPVTMYMLDGKNLIATEYYPAVNLRKRHGDMTLPMTVDCNYQRKLWTEKDMMAFLQVDSLESLDAEVADILKPSYRVHPVEFNHLVGLLVQSLVCIMCDYTVRGRSSPNHIHLGQEFSWVTDEIYLDACAAAELFYRDLDFEVT